MIDICNDIHKSQDDIENMRRKLILHYSDRIDEIKNYIEKRQIAYDEVGQDLLKIINGYTRLCSICSKPMNEGYCIENGMEYYCSDECLHECYTEEDFKEMYDDGNGDSYWTEWEE